MRISHVDNLLFPITNSPIFPLSLLQVIAFSFAEKEMINASISQYEIIILCQTIWYSWDMSKVRGQQANTITRRLQSGTFALTISLYRQLTDFLYIYLFFSWNQLDTLANTMEIVLFHFFSNKNSGIILVYHMYRALIIK